MKKELSHEDELLLDLLITQLQECCGEARTLSEQLPVDHPKIQTLRAALVDLDNLLYNHIDGWERRS